MEYMADQVADILADSPVFKDSNIKEVEIYDEDIDINSRNATSNKIVKRYIAMDFYWYANNLKHYLDNVLN